MIIAMRTRTDRELPDLDLDTSALGGASEGTTRRSLGAVGTLVAAVTLPVRLAGGLVGLAVIAVVGLARAIMLPIRLAVLLTKKIVQWASDLVYGVWRLVLMVIGAVLGLVRLVFRVLNATVGGAIRLLLRLVGGVLRALVWIFTLGRLSGARKAKKSAERRAEGDAVVEFDD